MRYRVTHTTEYLYSDRVSHCYNLAHMIPRDTYRQRCLNSDIKASPFTAHTHERIDYFGNRAYHFEIQRPHKHLVITARSEVETQPQNMLPSLDVGVTCAQARDMMLQNTDAETLMAREFLLPSPLIHTNDDLLEYAQASFDDQRPLLSAVMELTQRIFEEFTYAPEATTIATPLEEVMATRQGVCQDFAHLQIGCLRALGFAARYVSGYIETLPPPGEEKLVGSDASHAWIAVYSPTEGWFEFDPTNNSMASEQHLTTAWGRDYVDVTPLKGVIYGGGKKPVLNVAVDVARIN